MLVQHVRICKTSVEKNSPVIVYSKYEGDYI